jgi:resuscitation-promoting factor RpfB
MKPIQQIILMCVIAIVTACGTDVEPVAIRVTVFADGLERTYTLDEAVTVEEFLVQVNIEWDDNDRIAPPTYTQILDGTRITIVRIEEEEVCELEDIPYGTDIIRNEAFAPDEQVRTRIGQNGQQRVCYRVVTQDGVQQTRAQVRQPEVIVEPINEEIVVGVSQEVEPFDIEGTLAYINNGNAWVVQDNSRNKRLLTTTSDLDSLVVALAPDGRYLLYTREAQDSESFINELWLKETSGQRDAVSLNITDVLLAQWLPNEENTISYSTGESQEALPGWRALNNLWVNQIDPISGNSLGIRRVRDESIGGLYSWWGTVFRWSPDGDNLAWVEADGMGLLEEDGEQIPLLEYASFRVSEGWSWRANISWSWDGALIATVAHGEPLNNEPPETTPVFDVVIASADGNFSGMILERAGMWASPQFSPQIANPESPYPQGYLAYLRARDPDSSVYGEYDLIVADRDGSNARKLFPPSGQAGITWSDRGITPIEYTWSPDGRMIAVIHQGDLWVVEVETGVARQMTFDGGSEHPVWSP